MNKRWIWIVLSLLLVGMLVVGCGGDEEPQPTAEPAAETRSDDSDAAPAADEVDSAESAAAPDPTNTPVPPTATPEPVPTDTPEPVEEEVDLSESDIDLTDLDSYTMRMTLTSTAPDGTEQGMNMAVSVSADPPAQLITINTFGIEEMGAETPSEMQMALTDGTLYMSVPGEGCFSLPGGDGVEEEFLGDLPGVEDFTEGLGTVTRIRPNETINGIETIHYRFDEASFLDLMGDDDIESVTGDLYVAVDGGYLVRMEIEGVGAGMNLFDESESAEAVPFSIVYDIVDINQPIEIMLPEGCGVESGGSEYPMVDDASETMSFPGGLMYSTGMGAAELVEFYVDAMSAEGWTYEEADSTVSGDFATLVFSQDGERITINLLGGGDATQVMIAPEE